MARKRVTEEDLLDFSKRADELSSAVEKKYRDMDEQKAPLIEYEPHTDIGVLIISDSSEDKESTAGFLREKGYSVEVVDINSYVPIDKFDKTPKWQRQLDTSQRGYLALREKSERVVAIGYGRFVSIAAIIAEQYTIDGFALIMSNDSCFPALSMNKLTRLSKNNLFSIICPILAISSGENAANCEKVVRKLTNETRSDSVQSVFADTGNEYDVNKCILEFLLSL